jgi:glycerol 2-dehydrogenase (NADP+)
LKALSNGYRLIDTAQYYGIESIIGSAILASGIPRSEITVVTKFWGEWHHDPASALEKSLSSLGLGYIDIFLMHWPNAIRVEKDGRETNLGIDESPTFLETWKMMEGLVGPRCTGIGVSNFTQKTLQALIDGGAKILPCVNQVELHAFNPNLQLVPWSKERGIHTMSWR